VPSLQRFGPTIRGTHAGPFNDRCGSVTYSERCDFRCGSNSEVRARNWVVRFTLKNRRRQPGLSGPRSAITGSAATV